MFLERIQMPDDYFCLPVCYKFILCYPPKAYAAGVHRWRIFLLLSFNYNPLVVANRNLLYACIHTASVEAQCTSLSRNTGEVSITYTTDPGRGHTAKGKPEATL